MKVSELTDLVVNRSTAIDFSENHNEITIRAGHTKLKALEYRRTDIERAYRVQDEVHDQRTVLVSLLKFPKKDVVLKADVKIKLQEVDDRLGIDEKAKAIDIKNGTRLLKLKSTIKVPLES